MSKHYSNYKTVVYITADKAATLTKEKLESDYEFLETYIGLDKVYLETHRGCCDVTLGNTAASSNETNRPETRKGDCDVPAEQIRMIKDFLESKGVEVSGGITTTIGDFEGAEGGKQRLFDTFCYTDPAMRRRLKEIVEFTAGLYDEVILDDFYFTNCSCPRCIREKGDRDWVTFRRELMRDVSENLVVKPAKAVNPNIKMVIKYPNWRESYHFAGYVPEVQRDIFDATYIGTETRSPVYADQHLPEYLSYSLPRYMENAWPGRTGGGWFDVYDCWSVDRYLEQAYLTALSKVRELMHFCWGDLIDNPLAGALKIQLRKIDRMMEGTGRPVGIPVYLPFASSGENHLEMRLGMLGIPIEPVPYFPEYGGDSGVGRSDVSEGIEAGAGRLDAVAGIETERSGAAAAAVVAKNTGDFPRAASRLLLTESALADPEIVEKLRRFVESGGEAVITSGFFREAGDALRKAGMTEAELTGRKRAVTRYHVTGDPAGYYEHEKPILFPELVHCNNASWSLLNGGDGDLHSSLFLRSTYGKGKLYIMVIPENDSDLYRMPAAAADVLRRALCQGTYASGHDFSLFTYGDGSMFLYRYVKNGPHPAHVTLHTEKEVQFLTDTISGEKFPVHKVTLTEDFRTRTEYIADIRLEPGILRKMRWM